MICAIVSDIHSNLEALAAVLARIEALRVDAVYCLGDLVGYNADPDACVETVLLRSAAIVRGNHDKAVAGLLGLEWFNDAAREAALWTRRNIAAGSLDRLRALPGGPRTVGDGILLCHGTPFDEDEYLVHADVVGEAFRYLEDTFPRVRFCLHGHTHHPFVAARRRIGEKPRVLRGSEVVELEPPTTYLINPGSVGQPRDGIAAASFGILDTVGLVYRNLRVAYDVRETQRKIVRAGLPTELSKRLAEGR